MDASTLAGPRLPSVLAGTRSTLRKRSAASRHPDDLAVTTAAQSLFPPPARKRVSFVDQVRVETIPSFLTEQQRTTHTTPSSYSTTARESWNRHAVASQRSRAGASSATSLALTHHPHKFPLPHSLPDELEARKWVLGLGIELQSWGAWTSFKWCLLASVLSVFVYGMVGLVLGMMLWLHGKFTT